jgi:hypothetical protein
MKIVPYTLLLESEKDLGNVPPSPAAHLQLIVSFVTVGPRHFAVKKNLPFCLSGKGKEHICAEVSNSQE